MVRSYSLLILYSLVILLALVVRLPLLSGSFWLDEAAQATESARPLHQQLAIVYDFQPPLYHLLVHGFTYASHQEWWLRLASLLPGIATVVVIMLLAKELGGSRRTELLAGILMATSQYHVYYSQELRPYALAAFFGTLSSLFLLRWIQSSRRVSVGYLLTMICGLMSVYTYVPLVLGQLVYVGMFHRKRLVSGLLHVGIAGALLSWWLPTVWLQWQRSQVVAQLWEGWSTAVSLPTLKALPVTIAKFLFGTLPLGLTLDTAILLVLICLPVVLLVYSQRKLLFRQRYLVMVAVPLLLATLLNPWLPTLEPKRYLYALPMLLIFLAILLEKAKQRNLIIGLLLVGNLFGIYRYWTIPEYQREPWRDLIQTLEADAIAGDAAVFAFEGQLAPWGWYSNKKLITYSLLPSTVLDATQLKVQISSHEHLYLFEYLADLTDPLRQVNQFIEDLGYREIGFEQYPGVGKLIQYQRVSQH